MTATRGSGIPDLISAYTVAARDITCDLDLDHARVGDLDLDLASDRACDHDVNLDLANFIARQLARDLRRARDHISVSVSINASARDLAHLRNRARDLAGFLERLHLEQPAARGYGADHPRSRRRLGTGRTHRQRHRPRTLTAAPDAMTMPEGQCVSGGFAWYGSLLAQVRLQEGRR